MQARAPPMKNSGRQQLAHGGLRFSARGFTRSGLSCVVACALSFMANVASAAQCSVSTTGVSFGIYDTFNVQHMDSSGTIDVSCDVPAAYTIALSQGTGTYAARQMTSGIHSLMYNLYLDSERLTVWGDGSAGSSTVSGNAASATHTVYGRIEAQQNANVGTYTDVVVITLTF